MRIHNFNNFSTNEKLGISVPSLLYTDTIFSKTWGYFWDFYYSDKNKFEDRIIIPYTNIRPSILDRDLYSKFPVVGIGLNLYFDKNKKFDKKFGKGRDYYVGGSAMKFGNKNWEGYTRLAKPVKMISDHGVFIECGISIDLSDRFHEDKQEYILRDSINEAIWHELNHLYEFYQRVLNVGGRPVRNRSPKLSIQFAGSNKWGIPYNIFTHWNSKFSHYIYVSEPIELNARVQEAGYHVYTNGFESVYKTDAWEDALYMSKFSADEFIKSLNSKIGEYTDSEGIDFMKEKLKKMWLSEYEKSLSETGETATINVRRLKRESCDDFIKYFESRFIEGGKYLIKKIGKLVDIDPYKKP
jgi:hypothetical protein